MKRWKIAVGLGALVVSVAAATVFACGYWFARPVFEAGVLISTLHSKILAEDRGFIVHLPESYAREPERRYPVLYVLDGSSQDTHTTYSAALMARIGAMPELIVVGIPNVGGKGRQRDYTPPFMVQDIDEPQSPMGGGDKFLAFLKTELLPHIDQHYRTQPFRMLTGHSRGGLLAVYSLVAEPQLFQALFAHSPALWRDDTIMATKLAEYLAGKPALDTFLYLSLGTAENAKMTAAFQRTLAVLKAQAPSGLRWQADLTPDASHGNNAELATPVGFHALYRDWTVLQPKHASAMNRSSTPRPVKSATVVPPRSKGIGAAQ